MKFSSLYPVCLSLAGRHCLVVGFGAVGQRKLAGLLEADPGSVQVLDTRTPACIPGCTQLLAQDSRVSFASRPCGDEDIRASFMVFAATSDKAENRRIAGLCEKYGVLCNSATDPAHGNFVVPAIARGGDICVAISTGGASPLLARKWRAELADFIKPRQQMAWLLGQLRPLVLRSQKCSALNAALWKEITASPLEQWLADNEIDKSLHWLKSLLPQDAHEQLADIFSRMPRQ